MLTESDLQAIGKLFDKKLEQKLKDIATDVAAIEVRVGEIESSQATKLDLLELKLTTKSLEKRVTAVEGKITKIEERVSKTLTQADLDIQLKRYFRGTAQKKDLQILENRLIKKINFLINAFDSEIVETRTRISKIEQRLNFSSPS